MLNKCVIRFAKEEDAPFTMNIGKELISEGYGLKNADEFHDSIKLEKKWIASYEGADFFLVAEVDGEVVGFLNFDLGKLNSTKHQGTFGISVKRSARRKGIGKKLLAAMIDECNHKGDIDIIRLNVLASNTTAIRLYESFGFQKEARLIDYVRKNSKSEDMLHMTLLLTSRKTGI